MVLERVLGSSALSSMLIGSGYFSHDVCNQFKNRLTLVKATIKEAACILLASCTKGKIFVILMVLDLSWSQNGFVSFL